MKPTKFVYKHRVAYYETDMMGVVHHSNYVRHYEEARVEWLRDRGINTSHTPHGPLTFAVVGLDCQYMKSAKFDDVLDVHVEGRLEGIRIIFRYAIWLERLNSFISTGTTTLVPLDEKMNLTRLPQDIRDVFAQESWSETWPPTA